ncbi:bi-domain-containing oxidoreductase [Oleidesulfovibrio sp.]|uniref:bi-domain-containing oxidoreductase n=1 Tax=Oleidesulfovibrio sp. TaxID=2909707 RepID=UPI003A8A4769
MKQALIKKGNVIPADISAPVVSTGGVLIKVVNSCISAGTELSGLQTSGKSLIRQALEQPQKVVKALNMMRTEGVEKTVAKIRGHLEAGSPTGYSAAGIVVAVGAGVKDLRPGDRVAAAGAGYANHAEFIDVPRNLVMRMPENLDFQAAATVTLGGIAMQGVRRAAPALGEYVVIYGAGILGMLALRMCHLSGARVIAVDLDPKRLELAASLGAELCLNPVKDDVVAEVSRHTGGHLADIVLFCAATSKSKVLSDAFALTRKKGRLVMVGVWGDGFDRNDIYKKEIDFLISTSYGPGRYDAAYEEGGCDYPYAYVRWTENRNMAEYLRLIATGDLDVIPLIQGVYDIDDVISAYSVLSGPDKPMMVLLDYGQTLPDSSQNIGRMQPVTVPGMKRNSKSGPVRVALVGAGGYAQGMHLPNMKKLESLFTLRAVCSRTGTNAQAVATQYMAEYATTDYQQVLSDPAVDLVVLCTRHNLHGEQVMQALQAGKHVLVEKPLCITAEELEQIKAFYAEGTEGKPLLTVGFNRRFSKYADAIKKAAAGSSSPLFMRYRMNAGYLPMDHWTHGPEGGGRIVGEACHVLDLLRSFTGGAAVAFSSVSLHPAGDFYSATDNKVITVEYSDGSVGSIEYLSLGSSKLPKEHLEVHFDGKTVEMSNYQNITGFGVDVPSLSDSIPDKGQLEMLREIGMFLTGQQAHWPISFEELVETTAITLEVA